MRSQGHAYGSMQPPMPYAHQQSQSHEQQESYQEQHPQQYGGQAPRSWSPPLVPPPPPAPTIIASPPSLGGYPYPGQSLGTRQRQRTSSCDSVPSTETLSVTVNPVRGPTPPVLSEAGAKTYQAIIDSTAADSDHTPGSRVIAAALGRPVHYAAETPETAGSSFVFSPEAFLSTSPDALFLPHWSKEDLAKAAEQLQQQERHLAQQKENLQQRYRQAKIQKEISVAQYIAAVASRSTTGATSVSPSSHRNPSAQVPVPVPTAVRSVGNVAATSGAGTVAGTGLGSSGVSDTSSPGQGQGYSYRATVDSTYPDPYPYSPSTPASGAVQSQQQLQRVSATKAANASSTRDAEGRGRKESDSDMSGSDRSAHHHGLRERASSQNIPAPLPSTSTSHYSYLQHRTAQGTTRVDARVEGSADEYYTTLAGSTPAPVVGMASAMHHGHAHNHAAHSVHFGSAASPTPGDQPTMTGGGGGSSNSKSSHSYIHGSNSRSGGSPEQTGVSDLYAEGNEEVGTPYAFPSKQLGHDYGYQQQQQTQSRDNINAGGIYVHVVSRSRTGSVDRDVFREWDRERDWDAPAGRNESTNTDTIPAYAAAKEMDRRSGRAEGGGAKAVDLSRSNEHRYESYSGGGRSNEDTYDRYSNHTSSSANYHRIAHRSTTSESILAIYSDIGRLNSTLDESGYESAHSAGDDSRYYNYQARPAEHERK
jgi:hypothetical protein